MSNQKRVFRDNDGKSLGAYIPGETPSATPLWNEICDAYTAGKITASRYQGWNHYLATHDPSIERVDSTLTGLIDLLWEKKPQKVDQLLNDIENAQPAPFIIELPESRDSDYRKAA